MAPAVETHPEARPTGKEPPLDARGSIASAHSSVGATTPHQEYHNCFCCLEAWVFLGSLDHDGEGVYDVIGAGAARARHG